MGRVLIPIPRRDFDPTEVAVSWQVLTRAGHDVVFATPDGQPGQADPIMISGIGLDPWSFIPWLGRLRLFGAILRANADGRSAYAAMIGAPAFTHPLRWEHIDPATFDALLLGGGHRARGMREYLESPVLQRAVAAFFAAGKPVAAICHGVLLAARSRRADGRSVLYGRKTTALTWQQERLASRLAHIGRFWDADYYRTYTETKDQPAGFMSVEHEVTRALARPEDFQQVLRTDPLYRRKTSGTARDALGDDTPAFVVVDGNYVSARWPGDTHGFAKAFAACLEPQ